MRERRRLRLEPQLPKHTKALSPPASSCGTAHSRRQTIAYASIKLHPYRIKVKTMQKMPIFQVEPTETKREYLRAMLPMSKRLRTPTQSIVSSPHQTTNLQKMPEIKVDQTAGECSKARTVSDGARHLCRINVQRAGRARIRHPPIRKQATLKRAKAHAQIWPETDENRPKQSGTKYEDTRPGNVKLRLNSLYTVPVDNLFFLTH